MFPSLRSLPFSEYARFAITGQTRLDCVSTSYLILSYFSSNFRMIYRFIELRFTGVFAWRQPKKIEKQRSDILKTELGRIKGKLVELTKKKLQERFFKSFLEFFKNNKSPLKILKKSNKNRLTQKTQARSQIFS